MTEKRKKMFAILLMVFGGLCILFTEQIHSVFRYMLGGNMIAIGLCDLCRGIKMEEFRNHETKLTANGIVMMILGLVIIFHQGNADSIIGSIWGVIGLLKGTEELNLAIYQYFSKEPFVGKAVHAVIEILLAIILLVDPVIAVRHHLVILGIEFIWYGLELLMESKNNN